MVKHFCDISKTEVEAGDLYTLYIIEKESGKMVYPKKDISAFIKGDIEEYIKSITVQE